MVGPGHLDEELLAGVGPKAGDAMELADCEVEAHLFEPVDRPRGQPVAAGLVAGMLLLLGQDHLMAIAGEPVGRGRPRRATTDHDHGPIRHEAEVTDGQEC